ncbi:MAG TPA: asparagine synthase (glutamine-hydrolyzing) [Gemmatimonadales bacterium]|nr:asparagine synthase (glutamine-hydrolyzing) [Gemmatimonadales bacterium]
MCGIVGIVHHDTAQPVAEPAIRRMCDAIRHRGPDDEGRYVEGPVGLGMRRLSIIDLSGGHQPIFNEDRSCVIVFNGEIYNYRELREGLLARGHTLTTHSDTEAIVHLYEEMGERCVEPLRGMFALAIWDTRRRRLLLARDRFGIKPLYVVEGRWGLAFATELKALTALGLTQRTLDWEALDAYFQLGYIPAPLSPFADVRKLEPGFTLVWEPGKAPVRRRYWDLPKQRVAAPADAEDRVLAWLDESVKAHLVSDVPVAAFLSGGLDSSAVVASMALAGEVPHAFTARYHGSSAGMADESGLARALADRYGAKLSVIDVRPEVTRIFEPIVTALDEPHADESAIPSWLISEAVGAQYKVALTGTGGDEMFAGYRRHIGLLLGGYASRVPAPLRRTASAMANALPEPRGGGLGVDRLKRFLRTGEGEAPDRLLGYFSRLPGPLRERLYAAGVRGAVPGNAALERFRDAHADGGFDGSLSAALYLDYKTYLPDDILALSDRMAMAHHLEIRVPFADHVLLEQVFPLPDRLKVGLGKAKRLLRRALRQRLPDAHFRAPKRGFVGPTASWLRHELKGMVEDELSEARMRRLGYFDPATVTGLMSDHFGRRHNREGMLWELLCFGVWHRVYVESPAPPAYGAG